MPDSKWQILVEYFVVRIILDTNKNFKTLLLVILQEFAFVQRHMHEKNLYTPDYIPDHVCKYDVSMQCLVLDEYAKLQSHRQRDGFPPII